MLCRSIQSRRTLARRVLFIAAVAIVSARPTVTRAETTGDATALMRRVAATYARDVAGVVAVRSHSELTISAPVFRKRIVENAWYVFNDGSLVASSKKPDTRQPPLHDPYRTRYLDEYVYRLASGSDATPGTTTIAYDSATHDVAHAYGTFVVDDATARIVRGSETPYKLPWPTKSGRLDARWGGAAHGWFPLEIDGAFVGSIGPFVGHASYAQTLTGYARYASVAVASTALASATGLPSVIGDADGGPPSAR